MHKIYTSPIRQYFGSKRGYKTEDGRYYPAFVEPFLGAGHCSFARMNEARSPKFFFWAEIDSSVRIIYNCWLDPCMQSSVISKYKGWQKAFASDEAESWLAVRETFETLRKLPYLEPYEKTRLAAASLVVRSLTQGGSARTNRSNGLNVKPVRGQVDKFIERAYDFPKRPMASAFSISPKWEDALEQFEKSSVSYGEVLLDPQYWTENPADATYPNVFPHDESTFEMGVRSFERALQIAKAHRIVYFNYGTERMRAAIAEIADRYGVPLTETRMETLGQNQRKHQIRTKRVEHMWVVNRHPEEK